MDYLVWCSQNLWAIHDGNCLFIFRAHFTVPYTVLEVLCVIQFNSISHPVIWWTLLATSSCPRGNTFIPGSWHINLLVLPLFPLWIVLLCAGHYPLVTLYLSSPLLTPSSLPWQTPLCPGLPLGLPVGLLDSQMYISGLDLLSRSYTHRHSSLLRWKVSLILVISKTPWLNTSLVKLMTFAPVSGPLPWSSLLPGLPTSTPVSSSTFSTMWPVWSFQRQIRLNIFLSKTIH